MAKPRFGYAFVTMTLVFALVLTFIYLSWLLDRVEPLVPAFALAVVFAGGLSVSGHDALDRGSSWKRISDDLTRGKPNVTFRSTGHTLTALAESPLKAGVLYAGSDDGKSPRACLAQSGEWTELVAPTGGTFTIESRYALDRGTPCADPRS